MNTRLICKIIGAILMIESAFMILPLIVALIYKENDWNYFLITILFAGGVGAGMFLVKLKSTKIYAKEGLFIVGIAWVVMSLIGAVPYFISGFLPDFINAFFESVSGFTTSGITIVPDVESASHAMLFWRSMTHWIGGMGVLMFMLAISPIVGGASIHLMRAESPGPTTEKITPKISQTAKVLYIMYFVLTAVQIIALMISGLSLFQSTLISFGTLATGGFSYLNSSLAAFTVAQQIIVEVFMLLAGINFSLYFLVLTGKTRKVLKDIELRWYLIIVFAATAMISANVFFAGRQFDTPGEAIHQSVFAVLSSLTSTGFSACDYNMWPGFSQVLIVMLMFIGGCAGSTAGGIKVSRFVLLFKSLKNSILESVNPKRVRSVRYNDKTVPEPVIKTTMTYFGIVFLILIVSMIIVSLEPGMDISTSLASVATTLNNNGIELKNPAVGNLWTLSWWTRLVYIIDMLIGRLEIFPIFALFIYLLQPVNTLAKKLKRKADN
ncbi:MAG: TrkH family potassium uptake protein [Parasporobacterium sp.]|nr:TrkH family potassium uptake protein [Parasporobacterium sp.]